MQALGSFVVQDDSTPPGFPVFGAQLYLGDSLNLKDINDPSENVVRIPHNRVIAGYGRRRFTEVEGPNVDLNTL